MKLEMKFRFKLKLKPKKKESISVLKFIPEEAETKWDEIEINPIVEDENGYCEVVNEGEELFWSVYLHQLDGGLKCIADLPTKNDALKFAQLLNSTLKSRLH
ncbi:MAG: hypothetical protein Q7U86_01980 [Draconibacterium sp.]|nr:hypothetical protein [Draconibacterium sp.]